MNEKSANTVKMVEISNDQAGQRIDNFLLTQLKGVPKSHIYRLLRSGQVRVNKGRKKPDYRIQADDVVRIPPVRAAERTEADIPDTVLDRLRLAILFENNDILVINKPAGLAVHGGSELRFGIIEALRRIYPGQYLELVHRLDRDTSGCLVLAKNRDMLNLLHRALRSRYDDGRPMVEKTYLTLLQGQWHEGDQTISSSLKKHRRGGEHRVEADDNGKPAISHFELLQNYRNACYMQVRIDTGRTHQIRVHAASVGHPVAGDSKYGDAEFNRKMKQLGLRRLFLHASHIVLPIGDGISVHAPLSEDLSHLLDNMKK